MGEVNRLLSRNAEIRPLLVQSIPVSGFRFGRIHGVEPGDNLRGFAPGENVERVAVVPSVRLQSAFFDFLKWLCSGGFLRQRGERKK